MNFDFYMPAEVVSGSGCVCAHSSLLPKLGKSAMIVTGQASAKRCGALNDVCTALKKEGISFLVYDKIGENPALSACLEAAALARESKTDFIIGIGGGSPLDASKAIAILAANPHLNGDAVFSLDFRCPPLGLVLVGTTAGTGSEVTAVSVLTQDNGRKRSITHPYCYAKLSFADPSYTCTVPFNTTVSTALDAFSHTTEGWFSKKCSDVTRMFARAALPLIWEGLVFLCKEKKTPDSALREKLYYGSLYAGMVLNKTGTAFPHPMGYVLTEDFHVPHGKACCAFLPELIKRAAEYKQTLLKEYLSILNASQDEVIQVICALTDLSELRMTTEQAKAYADRWDNLKNFSNTPGNYSKELSERLLLDLFVK